MEMKLNYHVKLGKYDSYEDILDREVESSDEETTGCREFVDRNRRD